MTMLKYRDESFIESMPNYWAFRLLPIFSFNTLLTISFINIHFCIFLIIASGLILSKVIIGSKERHKYTHFARLLKREVVQP